MKLKFGCSWYAIARVAEENGLELPTSNDWTDEQIEQLKILADNYHYKVIAQIMGKTDNAIYLKAKKLGIILIQDRRKWTTEEELMLEDLWGNKSIEYIAKKLKRSIFSLKVKAVRMGLGPMIANNYDKITISDISELLSVSRDRIVNTWPKLGLKITYKKISKNKSYMTVSWNELLRFLENNQYEWDSRNLEKYMLGMEPEWLIEKRKRDIIENPLWYRKWTKEEVVTTEELFNIGKNYQEISQIINRSEWAVSNILHQLGYAYRLPQFWKGKELKYLIDNYKMVTYEEIAESLGRTEKAIGSKVSELGLSKRKKAENI
jgi:hypothetical protein